MKKIILTVILLLSLTACGEVEYELQLTTGDDIVYESDTWVDSGAVITINGIEYEMTRNETVDYTVFTEQIITYSYTYKEVEYTLKRAVLVLKDPDFNIVLKPGLDTVKLNAIFVDKGLIFNDDNESDFTVVVEGEVDVTTRGTYTITYTIYDMDGAVLTLYRIVNVIS